MNKDFKKLKEQFKKTIITHADKYQKWEFFSDFCKCTAISLYQPFRKDPELEKEYFAIESKYGEDIIKDVFAKDLLPCILFALENDIGDFLGEVFMELELGNHYIGQFFTPFHISYTMALISGNFKKNNNEVESFIEPCMGSSCMILARAKVLKEQNINYSKYLEVQGVDISEICFYMSYIQLSLCGISAEVIHGDSLAGTIYKNWYTPVYIHNAYEKQIIENRKNKFLKLLELLKDEIKEPSIKENLVSNKVLVPNDSIENKTLYSKEQIEVFSMGRLF